MPPLTDTEASAAPSEIEKICQRDVVCIEPAEDIAAAARLMREKHVGVLVVVQSLAAPAQMRKVAGILTDRDIVVAVAARDADPHALTVADVMSRNPLVVSEHTPLDAALGFMRDAGVRRVPVLNARGYLVGILSIDDVLARIAEQLARISGSIHSEQRAERLVRP